MFAMFAQCSQALCEHWNCRKCMYNIYLYIVNIQCSQISRGLVSLVEVKEGCEHCEHWSKSFVCKALSVRKCSANIANIGKKPTGRSSACAPSGLSLTTGMIYTKTFPERTGTVEFIEQPEQVIVKVTFTKYGFFDDDAEVRQWLTPLFARYEDDPRPVVMANQHSGEVAVVSQAGAVILSPD